MPGVLRVYEYLLSCAAAVLTFMFIVLGVYH